MSLLDVLLVGLGSLCCLFMMWLSIKNDHAD